MFTAFSTALSALNATATAIDVVGNNLANLNTPGYKTSVVYFRDLVAQSLGAGETQIGVGTARPLTIRQFTQGAIQASTGFGCAVQGEVLCYEELSRQPALYAPETSNWMPRELRSATGSACRLDEHRSGHRDTGTTRHH
jgi:flagellar hook protein FlgE